MKGEQSIQLLTFHYLQEVFMRDSFYYSFINFKTCFVYGVSI